ncbi:hypothetical protein EOL96_01675 [Candidatus Saccharibacteria bacterium]|nr:hypothetical protein [Candidatus Saccharibacteria bacterium]
MERRAKSIKNGQEIIEHARQKGHEINIGNQDLPIAVFADAIIESIKNNQITVVYGETGSGKTTQGPQFAFSVGLTVDQTQPRRSPAHESAKRIQAELSGAIPELHPGVVAVHTGEESTVSPETQITIFTDGMLLAVGYNSSVNRLTDPKVGNVTIIDEVHEANKNIEVLMGLLMKESMTNPDLRVVLMTATPNKDLLTRRITEITGTTPNVIEVPGRTYPIEYLERPGETSVSAALEVIRPGVGMQIFKPGIGEINDTIRGIKQGLSPDMQHRVRFFKYHSTIPSRELSEACSYDQGDEGVKIVVGTEAMESGLTVGNIQIVIDDGMSRQVWTDKRGFEGLYLMPISQAQCTQRAGRAGRLSPGTALLVSADNKTPFVPFADRPEHQVAQIQRLDLKKEVLALAVLGIDLLDFEIINKVEKLPIIRAKESLTILGALDDDGLVTEVGIEMNRFPVRTSLMRTIVESKKYSQDIQVMIAAMAGAVDAGGLPLYGPFASRDWRELSSESSSDLLRQLDLFIEAQSMSKFEQQKIGINPKNVSKAQETYEKILYQLGIRDGLLQHPNELQQKEMIECIYAGYVEHIFQRVGRTTFRLLEDTEGVVYKLSDRSVVDPRHPRIVVGQPYVIERTRRGGEKQKVNIIEAVTEVPSIKALGSAAVNLAKWDDETVVWRGGRAFKKTTQSIRGMNTGIMHESISSGDDVALRSRELIAYVLDHPGPAQQRLRKIKKQTEELNRRSRDGVTVMTHEGLLEFIRMAAGRVTELDANHLDTEIALIIEEHDISLYTYVSEQEVKNIERDSPNEYIVEDHIFEIVYSNGTAMVQHWSPEQIIGLREDVYLPDGRRVRFVHNKKKLTVTELRDELGLD